MGHRLAEQLQIPDAKGCHHLQGDSLRSIEVGEQPIDLLLLAAAEHLWRELRGRGFVVELGFQLPRFQESCHPSHQYIRGLEDMIDASLQRGRQG